ncbi:MAG: hypothetical protein V4563_16405, partial [Pseudomonadota bacterium]
MNDLALVRKTAEMMTVQKNSMPFISCFYYRNSLDYDLGQRALELFPLLATSTPACDQFLGLGG